MTAPKMVQVTFETSVTVEMRAADFAAYEDAAELAEEFEGADVAMTGGRAWLVFVDSDKALVL